MVTTVIRGRCISLNQTTNGVEAVIQSWTQIRAVRLLSGDSPAIGDWIEINAGSCRILTPCRSQMPRLTLPERVLDPRRRKAMLIRSHVESSIRDFFLRDGFFETRTPLLAPCPGMETHIKPFLVQPWTMGSGLRKSFLPTSPEFAMKRLLAGGLEKIFQICPAFRDEPASVTHRPEFTLLEWYRAFENDEKIMKDCEELFESIAVRLFGRASLPYQGKDISVSAPWPRLKVRDLFWTIAGVDLVKAVSRDNLAKECNRLGLGTHADETWDDLYFKIWLNVIEPSLPQNQAVFVLRYPPSQAALAVLDRDPDGTEWARRFEIYAGGLELGNAFQELTDPIEQHHRFEKDMQIREEIYGDRFPKTPIDEGFLEALEEGMPPCSGIAVGVDRLVMLFADEPDIDYTFWM